MLIEPLRTALQEIADDCLNCGMTEKDLAHLREHRDLTCFRVTHSSASRYLKAFTDLERIEMAAIKQSINSQ